MDRLRRSHLLIFAGLALVCGFAAGTLAPERLQAQEPASTTSSSSGGQDMKSEIDDLNKQVKQKADRVKELQGIIDSYKQRITDQENKSASLENEVLLLDNRITKKQYDIEQASTEIEGTQLEIEVLTDQIAQEEQRISTQKDEAADLIRRIHQGDGVEPLEVLLTQRSLSAFFDQLEQDKRLERDLEDALTRVQNIKDALEGEKKQRDDKRTALEQQKKDLTKEKLALEAERNFKASLADETKLQESQFQQMLYEVQAQQQSTSDDISTIESSLKDKLDTIDQALARGDVLLSWPVDPTRGITCKFHDPDYPFKNLFQHPGTDIRASVGTPIHAAAGGYVAWNKLGRLYGNYTMIVHPGNIATVYAHLTKFLAKPDTYVDRGDVIGLSGGMPGQPGAGLSTGPHLHFEVRQNGIPVDPENFLPSSDSYYQPSRDSSD